MINEKSARSLFAICILIISIVAVFPMTSADDTACTSTLATEQVILSNGTSFNISIVVEPQTPAGAQPIDAIGVDLTYTTENLEYVGHTWGNMFNGTLVRINPVDDPTNGTINNTAWGDDEPQSHMRYFCNYTFRVKGIGTAYINQSMMQAAYHGGAVASRRENNLTFDLRENVPPYIGTPNVENGSIDQSIPLVWNISVRDVDNDSTTCYINCSNGENTSFVAVNGTETVGEITIGRLAYNTTYTVWVNATDGSNWAREWFTFTTGEAPPLSMNDPFPVNGSTEVARPPANISIQINGSGIDAYVYFLNMTPIVDTWTLLQTYTNISTQRIAITDLATFGTTYEFNWGNTTYTWSINITDGVSWENNTFTYTTLEEANGANARYDVNNNDDVDGQDCLYVWNNRDGYDGIYDVNSNNDVDGQDVLFVWNNKS